MAGQSGFGLNAALAGLFIIAVAALLVELSVFPQTAEPVGQAARSAIKHRPQQTAPVQEAPPQPPTGACNENLVLTCATMPIADAPGCKTTGRITITDMAVWNDNLFFGTNSHGSCEDVGEVYLLNPSKFGIIGDHEYFNQQGVRHIRYGKDNILVPGLDPNDDNNYKLFAYNTTWTYYSLLPDASGHLADTAYFKGKYYTLSGQGNVIVTDPTTGRSVYFKPAAPQMVMAYSLAVWNNVLYFAGPVPSPGCDPKTNSSCTVMYQTAGYDGSVGKLMGTAPSISLETAQPFKNKLYFLGADDLYSTEDMMSFSSANLLKNLAPVEGYSRKITDLAVVGDKLYAAVLVQKTGIGTVRCNEGEKDMASMIVTAYEIYSTKDGINWKREYYKEVFLKNYPDISFQLVNYQNQLYVGMTDGIIAKGFLFQYGNVYKATSACV